MPNSPKKVFIDANVLIQTGKPPGGPIFDRILDLVEAGFIEVLTTDLTKAEVAKKYAQNDYDVIKEIGRPHFRKIASVIEGVELPEVTKAEIKEKLRNKYVDETEAMFRNLNAKELSIDSVAPTNVFTDYTNETGFFSGEVKKDQFPDAFIFECLNKEASSDTPVIIISNDGDFQVPCISQEHITILKTIPDLFKNLGLVVEAPDIEGFLEEHQEEVVKMVDGELSNWALQAIDVEDGETDETTVKNVCFTQLMSFGQGAEGKGILVVGKIEITADATYTHPSWDTAIYDSEDKVLIPFESVNGETEIELEADFSMSLSVDDEGRPAAIDEFNFRNDEFIWINLYSNEAWGYK